MSELKLKRRINALTIYIIFSTLIFGALFFWLYKGFKAANFDELTVKRLNLVGEDGSLRMVISNETRQHSGRIDGKDIAKRERPAGIIFFDNNGNECGGLVYNEHSEDGKVNKMMSFTMDNYKNDQVLQLINDETYSGKQARVRRGMVINEYPVGAELNTVIEQLDKFHAIKDTAIQRAKIDSLFDEVGAKKRLFIGRTKDNQSGIFMYDNDGRPRMQIFVDSAGNPQVLSFDSRGRTEKMLRAQ